MIGKYTFYYDGKVIGESTNLITTAGKRSILEFLAGYTSRLVGTIAVGVGTTAANIADTELEFEISRQPVTNTGVNYASNGVVIRAQLPATEAMIIREVGARTSGLDVINTGSQVIMDFNDAVDVWSSGTWVATNSRIGSALRVSASVSSNTTSTLSGLTLDLSGYASTDKFKFAHFAGSNVSSIVYTFLTDDTNYYSYTVSSPTANTYAVVSALKSAFTATGSPSWANITKVSVRVNATAGGAATVDFDGIRVEDVGANREESVLVSRSVLVSPITKQIGLPLDIEYMVTI